MPDATGYGKTVVAGRIRIMPDVMLFTHRVGGSDSTELIVAANAFGPTGTVPMVFGSNR